ncbi:BQ5605_C022g09416 [Microbotryum silenes-dioicae]|uniref:BQ5605_C022g09416 protein n=1 Tax=Microbotryum silenes-dioicae TaxID=796604 RepID=A0A2X0PL40_9BASI|nr:BQ5605_C022g09416 [Microbotryum silenes-dioicae]
MSSPLSAAMKVDRTTVLLGVVAVVLIGIAVFLRPPPPQTHPFLLGRQSTSAPTRKPSESPVYGSSSTGGVRAPIRPDKSVKRLRDVLERSKSCFEGGEQGSVWIHRGDKLLDVVLAVKHGLLSTLGKGDEPVAVVIEHPADAFVATLAVSLTAHRPIVIAPGSKIPADLEPVGAIIYSASLLSTVQFIPGSSEAKTIVLGASDEEEDRGDVENDPPTVAAELLITGRSLLAEAKEAAEKSPLSEKDEVDPKDVALTIVSDGVALPLTHIVSAPILVSKPTASPSSEPPPLKHPQNLTASIVSFSTLFLSSPKPLRPTIYDSLLSLHHPSTPYGFGLALFTVYTSCSLALRTLPEEATHEDLEQLLAPTRSNGPPATLVFGPTSRLSFPLYRLLLSRMLGDSAAIIRQSRNGKIRLLREGVITRDSVWDSLLFKGVRKDAHLTRLRAVFFTCSAGADDEMGPPLEQARAEMFKATLGIPVVSVLAHSAICGPIANSIYYDAQRLPSPVGTQDEASDRTHVGAPSVGVELKLIGCDEAQIQQEQRFKGEIVVRTSVLPHPKTLPTIHMITDDELPALPPYPDAKKATVEDDAGKWFKTSIQAEMGKEGALWLL